MLLQTKNVSRSGQREILKLLFSNVSDGNTSWSSISLFGTGSLPTTAPVGIQDGDYWYDNIGSPTALYQWSADERNIDDWIPREFEEDTGAPSGTPIKELQLYNGNDWDVLPDVDAVVDIIAAVGSLHLNLDTSNGPLTGNLEIDPSGTPILTLTGPDATVAFNTDWTAASDDSISGDFQIRSTISSEGFDISVAGVLSVTLGGYEGSVILANDIPNKQYVDNQIGAAVGADRYIDSGTFGTGILTLQYFSGSPSSFDVTGFDSNQIPFVTGTLGTNFGGGSSSNVDEALTKAAPIVDPSFFGTVYVPSIINSSDSLEAANKGYVDALVGSAVTGGSESTDALRDVQNGSGTSFFVSFSYTAGNNRLMVFKNGVKQYKDVQASSTAIFSPALVSSQLLTGLDKYTIIGINVGANTWTISGDHSAEFTAGDTFEVSSNGGGSPNGNGNYQVASATAIGSPPTATDIVVAGSPGIVAGDATGTLGIDYQFSLTVDGVFNIVTPINVSNTDGTVDSLIIEMQAAVDLVFGAGIAAVYLYDGDIKIDSLGISSGSPLPNISMSNGPVPTSDLFDLLNLGVDGFTGFNSAAAVSYGYYESNGPGIVADSGSSAQFVEFNATTIGSDIIEFLKV